MEFEMTTEAKQNIAITIMIHKISLFLFPIPYSLFRSFLILRLNSDNSLLIAISEVPSLL